MKHTHSHAHEKAPGRPKFSQPPSGGLTQSGRSGSAHVGAPTPKAPLPSAAPSLLMASAGQRLLGAAALLAMLWAAVAWALQD